MKHLVTRVEAMLVRAIARGELHSTESWRVYCPPGVGSQISVVPASGRSGCRECGETIPAGEDAIVFGFDPYADPAGPVMRSWARLGRSYIHAAPCRDYTEEDT